MENNIVRKEQNSDFKQDMDGKLNLYIEQEKSDTIKIETDNIGLKPMKKQSLFIEIDNYFFGELSKSKIIFMGIYFILISVLEVLAYKFQGGFSVIASRIWMIGGLFCFIGIIAYFMKSTILNIKEKKILPVIIMFSLLIYLAVLTGNLNLTEINPDAAQQAAAGMSSFSQTDLNYTGKAFLGYPNRQYIITVLPSLLFGRSIATLHWGFAVPFLLGLLILYCGLRKWADKSGVNTNLAVLPIIMIFVFPFVTEYYANFEQAIYPISFTMIAIGFYLLILCKPEMVNIIGLAWTCCILSNSYTPALATLGLLLVFILMTALLLFVNPDRMSYTVQSGVLAGISLLMVEMNSIIFFAATLFGQRQDRITTLRSEGNLITLSLNSIRDFLTDKNATFLGMAGALVIIYLIAGLTYRLKIWNFIISLWVLAVFAVTNLLTGYTSYQPAWIMQRALIVIPVLVTGISLTAFDLLKKKRIRVNRSAIILMALAFAFLGASNFTKINQSFTYFNHIQPMKYMLQDLEQTVKENGLTSTSRFNLVVYTDNILMKNAGDYCKFLYPNAIVYNPVTTEVPAGINTKLDTIVYGENKLSDKIPAKEYSTVQTYDTRYDLEVIWYKETIIK